MSAVGWECPRCHACYAPVVTECGRCAPKDASAWPIAQPPWWMQPRHWPGYVPTPMPYHDPLNPWFEPYMPPIVTYGPTVMGTTYTMMEAPAASSFTVRS